MVVATRLSVHAARFAKAIKADWPWLLVALVIAQSVAAFVYGWQNPELTQMQVMQAAGAWSIPLRWL